MAVSGTVLKLGLLVQMVGGFGVLRMAGQVGGRRVGEKQDTRGRPREETSKLGTRPRNRRATRPGEHYIFNILVIDVIINILNI